MALIRQLADFYKLLFRR